MATDTMTESTGSIDRLGAFCSRLTPRDAPPEVMALATWKILDSLACAYLGAASEVSEAGRGLTVQAPDGPSTAILGGRRVSAPDATFANSAAIHALLQDDVDLTIGHPACTVIPAALAVGELTDAAGPDVIAAIIAGYEAMWRVGGRGTWMIPAITRGFRGNTILGAFGSAAASARVLGLDGEHTANAIACAASFAAGLLAPLNAGAMERAFQQAHNAQAGVTAALLAAQGIDAHRGVLRGAGGFYEAFIGEDSLPDDFLEGLGESFYLTESMSKPYPSAGSNTVGIAVLDHLLHTHHVAGRDISRITMEVVQRFTGRPGYPAIANPGPFATLEEALISFPFGLACMAVYGAVDLNTLSRGLQNEEVFDLARRVELVAVDVPYPLWCRLRVEDRSGDALVATADEIDWRRFHLDEVTAREKFVGAATAILPDGAIHELVSCVIGLASGGSARELTALLRSP